MMIKKCFLFFFIFSSGNEKKKSGKPSSSAIYLKLSIFHWKDLYFNNGQLFQPNHAKQENILRFVRRCKQWKEQITNKGTTYLRDWANSRKNRPIYVEEVYFGKDDHPGFSSKFLGPPWIFSLFIPDLPWIFRPFYGPSLDFLLFFLTHPGF